MIVGPLADHSYSHGPLPDFSISHYLRLIKRGIRFAFWSLPNYLTILPSLLLAKIGQLPILSPPGGCHAKNGHQPCYKVPTTAFFIIHFRPPDFIEHVFRNPRCYEEEGFCDPSEAYP